jgi:hypothetical protein
MNVTRYSLWENVPCTTNNYEPWIEHYAPKNKITKVRTAEITFSAVLLFITVPYQIKRFEAYR